MDIIKVQDLNYYYKSASGDKLALDNINLTVSEGEFVAVIGTNGSGKSTLAKHFNALLLPFSGKVFIDNLDTSIEKNLWNIRANVAMVFQNPDNQIIAAIVEDDVAFGLENLGLPAEEIRSRVDFALKCVGLLDFKNFAPSKLSGGQKQRLAVASAIAMQSKIIVFDEPTAMLDPIGRRELLQTVKNLHAQGTTIIYITHFMEEALAADKILLMDGGKIITFSSPRDIFSDVDAIKNAGLELPAPVEFARRLQLKGFKCNLFDFL